VIKAHELFINHPVKRNNSTILCFC